MIISQNYLVSAKRLGLIIAGNSFNILLGFVTVIALSDFYSVDRCFLCIALNET